MEDGDLVFDNKVNRRG